MNGSAIQQKVFISGEEMVGNATASGRSVDKRDAVVCPKPRRLGLIHTTLCDPYPLRPLRLHPRTLNVVVNSHQQEVWEAKAGIELLDIVLAKGGRGSDQSAPQAASSPPFFLGSPPSRVSNPLIKDARFGAEKFAPVSPHSIPNPSGSSGHAPSPSSARKGGCVRANFGNNPAVRVEGFDCLDRDRRNCSIPTLA